MRNIFRISIGIFLFFIFYSCKEKTSPATVTTSAIADFLILLPFLEVQLQMKAGPQLFLEVFVGIHLLNLPL